MLGCKVTVSLFTVKMQLPSGVLALWSSLDWFPLLSCEIVAPVPNIENSKDKWEKHPREHINLFSLKLEVFYPK